MWGLIISVNPQNRISLLETYQIHILDGNTYNSNLTYLNNWEIHLFVSVVILAANCCECTRSRHEANTVIE